MSALALHVELTRRRLAVALARRDGDDDEVAVRHDGLAALAAEAAAATAATPMARLAAALALTPLEVDLLWTTAAIARDPALAVHAEALGGSPARRGLSVALFAVLLDAATGAAADALGDLAVALAGGHRLLELGLLATSGDGTVTTRTYDVPARVLAHLAGDDRLEPGLRAVVAPATGLVVDDGQAAALAELTRLLADAGRAVLVVEGPARSGRATAIAHAAGAGVVVLDGTGLTAAELPPRLTALHREATLRGAWPVLADADRLGDGGARALAAHLARGARLVVTTATPGLDVGVDRPVVRVTWPSPDVGTRRRLWERLAGTRLRAEATELDALAQRYRIGAGAIARALESASIARPTATLDGDALRAGLRHNIAEQLGGLATRVEVTQRWDELVLAEDTLDQVHGLIARVRHAHQVLERWRYRGKMARGTGVPALFSGPPGTGKTMVAGLIAAELELELYQVDLSQVVSKWIGETEKQLARVFDVAEQGHALLLFDEADALFGQRSAETKGAVDRYANLEVNFLLQRVESFGGITILTTNLDASIDRALKRRLAAHIVFDVPDEDERRLLWQRLIHTGAAPLAPDLDLDHLARAFPKMTGAHIRNAALSAAFFAAADASAHIGQPHLLRAARAEYRSMGHILADRQRG